ncbi:MAG: group III truncated hemoglobin [Bacteroidia bacterium]|nr:group III truncated hemoglobin [Bacteroidia bacterium]
MDNKPDITTRTDIEKLIVRFYEKVKPDETIGFIFTEVAKINWEHHIHVIVDFWETILLDNPVYTKNAMEVHYTLNQRVQLTGDHFNTWIRLFSETVDELYEGKIALLAKTRAKAIASLMEYKMANETR